MSIRQSELLIVAADYIRETKDSYYLDCEGDLEWFPKKLVKFNAETKELEAPRWLLEEKFPDTKF